MLRPPERHGGVIPKDRIGKASPREKIAQQTRLRTLRILAGHRRQLRLQYGQIRVRSLLDEVRSTHILAHYGLFNVIDAPLGRQPREDMLRALENEIPAQV
jgi:hypothetical protein